MSEERSLTVAVPAVEAVERVVQRSAVVVEVKGKKVLVMGLGRFGGGVGVARWLVQEGAVVTVNDAAGEGELAESMKALEGLGVRFVLGGHPVEEFVGAELIVVNPAVDKGKVEAVKAALEKGVPTTTEMNLFVERCKGITVGVTGSVGKSTTVMLMYEALKAGLVGTGRKVFLGGNIGKSLLGELGAIGEGDVVLLELSSFMLEETPAVRWSPHIAVVTNLYANHLDRHGDMAGYAAAKQNILAFQGMRDVAIVNGDHAEVAGWARLARVRVVTYKAAGAAGLKLVIPGEHNQSNAAAALAVVEALEAEGVAVDRGAAAKAIERFKGLSHRLQLVHTLGIVGVEGRRSLRFYNDSKATSPDASVTALMAFRDGKAVFFAGGYDKHIDLSRYERALATWAGGVIGIGQTGEGICERVKALGGKRAVYAGTLEEGMPLAVKWAKEDGKIEAVVLSPASASWGQFVNYEQRGERFIEIARGLR